MSRTSVRHIDRFGLQVLPPREGEHAFRQRRPALGRLHGVVEQAFDPGIIRDAFTQQLQIADHDREQVVEVVRDPARKLTDRLHLLGLEQNLPRRLQRLLGVAPLRDVSRDLGKADEVALLVSDRDR